MAVTSGDQTAKVAKIFLQMFCRNPLLEPHVRVAARKLREMLGRTLVARKSIEDQLKGDGVSYSVSEMSRAWKRTHMIWDEMDRENLLSAATAPSTVRFEHRFKTGYDVHVDSHREPARTKGPSTRQHTQAADNAWRYDQSINPGDEYIWIREYIYRTKKGRTVTVRGHWRRKRMAQPKADTSWKFKKDSNLEPEWTWTEGFRTATYSVRSHWRAKRSCWRKSAEKGTGEESAGNTTYT